MAKKAAGATIGAMDLDHMELIVQMISEGTVNPRQLRGLLKNHIPASYSITPSDVCNFRARALKHSLENKPVDSADAQKLLEFAPLAADESINIVDDDVSREKIAEYLRLVLQDTAEGWKALAFLQKCKDGTTGFDYRIDKDDNQRPIGICWITNSMRKAWIKFGLMVFLDAMKRKMNSLHWPYIGPVAGAMSMEFI